jgi:hypothetical protein
VEVTSEVGLAGLGLVVAAPDGPVEAVGDGVFAVVNEIEETADFGEGECDQALMGGWHSFWSMRLVGWIVVGV